MEKIKMYYDPTGNTLSVWFDDPKRAFISEETGEETILVKDKDDNVIGFEKLNYSLPTSHKTFSIPVEIARV